MLAGFAMFLIEGTRCGYLLKKYDTWEIDVFLSNANLEDILKFAFAARIANLGLTTMTIGSLFK